MFCWHAATTPPTQPAGVPTLKPQQAKLMLWKPNSLDRRYLTFALSLVLKLL
jgi:hypothetical protein